MSELARQRHTFRQYVQLEQLSPIKHEFLDGHVWAMAGGTPDHAAVAVNVSAWLSEQLRGKPCRVFSSDLRVRVKATGLATYPDVTVVCDRLEKDPDDPTGTTIVNPRIVVEVLSPSTEDYDRGEKLEHYKKIPSLQEVVLVAHDARRIEVWHRQGDAWVESVTRATGEAELPSLDIRLPIDEVYRDPLANTST